MTRNKKSHTKKPFPVVLVLLIALAAVVLLTAGGFGFAASQETHDSFCASCHSQPETTYYQRSTAAQPVDLASYHTTQQVECINCHSGVGLTGRLAAELLGARNAMKWYTGTAVQPAPLTVSINDENCLKCHQDVTQRNFSPKENLTAPGGRGEDDEDGRNNHWHVFLARWQAADPNAATCVSCHPGHTTDGSPQSGYMNTQTVQEVCQACHQNLGREGGG
jgi:nitrate/TMAO reductase-like tetraheme cytochrome c subunit